MAKLDVSLGNRSYPIHVGKGLLDQLDRTLEIRPRPCLVVSDTHVAPLYLERVLRQLGPDADSLVLPAGESEKKLSSLQRIWDHLAARRFPRDGVLLALGGGVVGDITGLAAATWMRGCGFVQLPTTLLAQVDASVGGKTAINLEAGKNLVGAFHQPEAVIIDTDTLATLPGREYAAGLAEVLKAALIDGEDHLAWLEHNANAIAIRDEAAIEDAILRSCRLKAMIVAADERESGQRALLNLGHTFGHAIETGLGHGEWLHGEAVAAGMMLALKLSEKHLGLETSLRTRVRGLLETFGLPVAAPPGITPDTLLELMAGDKKVDSGGWKLVLVAACGDARIQRDVPRELIREVLENPA